MNYKIFMNYFNCFNKDKNKNKDNAKITPFFTTYINEKNNNLVENDWVIHKLVINYTKMNVPFRNKLMIKPLYNIYSNNPTNIVALLSISRDVDQKSVSLYTDPYIMSHISNDFDTMVNEIENLPFAIVITTHIKPFIIQYINNEWEKLCRYTPLEAVGRTFQIIQGKDNEKQIDAKNFGNEITEHVNKTIIKNI